MSTDRRVQSAAWQRLAKIRARLLQSSCGDLSLPRDKKHRPAWLLRLACTAMDVGAVAMLLSPLFSVMRLPEDVFPFVGLVAVPVYYAFWEWLIGRTPAKVVLGCRMIPATGDSLRARMIARGLLRMIPVLNFCAMLSWKRVTLLDLISGTRVQTKPIVRNRLTGKGKKTSQATPAQPRGFDEKMSQR
jgi:hypothetical protein